MLDVATVEPGTKIPPFSRRGTFQHWNRFAAVNYEFAGHHMDDQIAQHEGFPAAIGMAPLIWSYIHLMLREWGGETTSIEAVQMRLRSPFLRGRTLTAQGEVRDVRRTDAGVAVDVDFWAEDDDGGRLIDGSATVTLPR